MAELRSSYRRMALRTHPDKGGSPEDFRQVLEAFAVLSSSRARAAYDSSLRARKEAAGSRSRTAKHTTLNPQKKPKEGRAQPASSSSKQQTDAQQQSKFFPVPPPTGHASANSEAQGQGCGSGAKKQASTQPTSNHPARQVSACMARLRELAVRMPRPLREASLQALLPQLRSRLLEFMSNNNNHNNNLKKSEVDPGQIQHAPESRHSRRGMLGTEGPETPQERVLEDPGTLAPVSPRSDSSKSTSTSDESDIDEVLALENEECSTLFAIEDAADVAMGLGEADSGESDPDCRLPTAATRASKRQAGESGYRGVSRKVNTKTGLITYSAGVVLNHLTVRSTYTANAEESLDFHIILVQLRECVEQGVEGADGIEGPLAFEQSLRAACKQRQEELSKMSLSFSVAFRAFGVRLLTPTTTSLEEALEVRRRLLTAREQGVSAMQACLLEVLVAGRTNVHRKRSRSWSQAEAEDFVGLFAAKCEANQLRREPLQRRKEALEERLQQRRAQQALKTARKLERQQHLQERLQQRWQGVVGRAQRAVQQEQKLGASSQQHAAAAVAEAARAKVRAETQARRVAKSSRRPLSWTSMKNLTFEQQQAAAETAAAAAAASRKTCT
ncbi:unnamed protein product [Polarella glacialis]|uniref:J domain-containing protein n=1 Tax=Polarella glacialis TaxID=89957 RepID=A0A813D980_POLGL|nr:unnamed protein product [Polarella glacialis]